MNADEIRKLLSPEEYTCPFCHAIFSKVDIRYIQHIAQHKAELEQVKRVENEAEVLRKKIEEQEKAEQQKKLNDTLKNLL